MIDDTEKPESYFTEVECFTFNFDEHDIKALGSLMFNLKDVDTSKCINSLTKRYVSYEYWLGLQDALFDHKSLRLDVVDTVNFYNLCELAFAIFDEKPPKRGQGIVYYEGLREKIEKSKSEPKNSCFFPEIDMGDSQTKKISYSDKAQNDRKKRSLIISD